MYAVAFIFEPGEYDRDFHELDEAIQGVAESMDGYVGKESWQSADGSRKNATYYWKDEASIRAFAAHPKHLEAKRQYSRWYDGYHVVVSKVERSYGDGAFPHVTPDEGRRGRRP